MVAIATRHVLDDQKDSVELASIAGWNAACRYLEMEADDTLVVAPAASSSNGTLLAVPPIPSSKEKLLFSEINQKRVAEHYKDGIYANSVTGKLHCSCKDKSIASEFNKHFNTKGHQKYKKDRLDDTELKRLKNMHDTYLQKLEIYKNMYCLEWMTTCENCFKILSEEKGGKMKHASKYSYTLCA